MIWKFVFLMLYKYKLYQLLTSSINLLINFSLSLDIFIRVFRRNSVACVWTVTRQQSAASQQHTQQHSFIFRVSRFSQLVYMQICVQASSSAFLLYSHDSSCIFSGSSVSPVMVPKQISLLGMDICRSMRRSSRPRLGLAFLSRFPIPGQGQEY